MGHPLAGKRQEALHQDYAADIERHTDGGKYGDASGCANQVFEGVVPRMLE
jgi:hypothetical protein